MLIFFVWFVISKACSDPKLRICLRVWRGGKGLGKKEGVSGRNRGHWKTRALGIYFSSKYKTLFI